MSNRDSRGGGGGEGSNGQKRLNLNEGRDFGENLVKNRKL